MPTSGLVLGKFMPLHRGHELLLHFADRFVDRLYVVVDRLQEEAIPGEVRCRWVRETVPGAQVFYLDRCNPQDPSEHPDFWVIWRESLLGLLPERPDFVFASETYGMPLAQALGATCIPLDLDRQTIPVSATQIRNDPDRYWDYLSRAARPHYLRRICIFGPESTGKTTLTQALAAHFQTVWVPEYARWFIEAQGDPALADMLTIAKGQMALESAIAPTANRWLFCDTDPTATTLWSRWLFSECSEALQQLADSVRHDFYVLTDTDVPWQADRVRYFPEGGNDFLTACKAMLERQKKPYAVVSGSGEARLANAIRLLSGQSMPLINSSVFRI